MIPVVLLRGARGAAIASAVLLAGCTTTNRAEPACGVRAPADVPPGWGRMRPLLDAGHARIAAHDVAGLKALAPRVNEEGLGLLKANMPHDVARPDAPRFLEGRALFGRALLDFARAVEAGDRDADLPDLFLRLSEAWHAWMRAMRGLPPERAL